MKFTVTLTPSEWMELSSMLIEQKLQAEREAANPVLKCIKSYNEHKAACAKELHAIMRERLHITDEEESEND